MCEWYMSKNPGNSCSSVCVWGLVMLHASLFSPDQTQWSGFSRSPLSGNQTAVTSRRRVLERLFTFLTFLLCCCVHHVCCLFLSEDALMMNGEIPLERKENSILDAPPSTTANFILMWRAHGRKFPGLRISLESLCVTSVHHCVFISAFCHHFCLCFSLNILWKRPLKIHRAATEV